MADILTYLKNHIEPHFTHHNLLSFYLASALIVVTLLLLPQSKIFTSRSFFHNISLSKLLGLILGFCFLIFFLLSAFVYPDVQDFAITMGVHKDGGPLSYCYIQHTTFDGRYFVNFLYAFNPLVFDSYTGYKLLAFLFFILFFLSVWTLIHSLTNQFLKVQHQLIGTLVFCCLYLFEMPNVWNSFYYMPSSYVYITPVILILFLTALMVRLHQVHTNLWKLLISVTAILLVIAIIGCNELFIPLMLVFTGITASISLWKGSSEKWMMVGLLITTLCASAANMTAPGLIFSFQENPVEKDFEHLLLSLRTSIYQGGMSILKWTLHNPALFLLSALYIPVSYQLSEKSYLIKKGFYLHPLIAFLLLTGGVLLGSFPYYWSLGVNEESYPPRVFNVIYFIFLIGWFLTIQSFVSYLSRTLPATERFLYFQPNKLVALCSFVLCLLFAQNFKRAFYDLFSGEAIGYEQQMSKRYNKLIKGSKKPGDSVTVEIQSLKFKPRTIGIAPAFEPNRGHHGQNLTYEEYFDVWEVRYATDTITKKEYLKRYSKQELVEN